MVTVLAETNRAPFDLAEGESELVSGFNVEFRGSKFAFIFMAEYLSVLIIRALRAALFFGRGAVILGTVFIAFLFCVIRATFPRYRYDQLIMLT